MPNFSPSPVPIFSECPLALQVVRRNLTSPRAFCDRAPNLVTQCLLNVPTTMPKPPSETNRSQPRIVVISTGLTPTTNRNLPLVLRPMYSFLSAQRQTRRRTLALALRWKARSRLCKACHGHPVRPRASLVSFRLRLLRTRV